MSEDYLFGLIGQCEGDIEDLEDGLSEAYAALCSDNEQHLEPRSASTRSHSVDYVSGSYKADQSRSAAGSTASSDAAQAVAATPKTARDTEVYSDPPAPADAKAHESAAPDEAKSDQAPTVDTSADEKTPEEEQELPAPAAEIGWDPLDHDRSKLVRNVASLYVYSTLQYALLEATSRLEEAGEA